MPHTTDEELELYALSRLDETRSAAVEEHLLICEACRVRLDDGAHFALAMRAAIASEPPPTQESGWRAWLRPAFTRPVWGVTAFAAVALAGFVLYSGRAVPAPLASIELTAMRGESGVVPPARETDVALADAPTDSGMRAELVNSGGRQLWSGSVGNDHKLRVRVVLSEGDYFVRLHDAGGALLHEYGFTVSKPSGSNQSNPSR